MVSVKVRLKLSAIYYADMVVKELTNNKQVVRLIILILLNQTVVNVELTILGVSCKLGEIATLQNRSQPNGTTEIFGIKALKQLNQLCTLILQAMICSGWMRF